MKRHNHLLILIFIIFCTSQMCAKEDPPAPSFDPAISPSKENTYTLYAPELGAARTLAFSVLYADQTTTFAATVAEAEVNVQTTTSGGAYRVP